MLKHLLSTALELNFFFFVQTVFQLFTTIYTIQNIQVKIETKPKGCSTHNKSSLDLSFMENFSEQSQTLKPFMKWSQMV